MISCRGKKLFQKCLPGVVLQNSWVCMSEEKQNLDYLHALFVGRQLCWKDHLVFICHAVYMYRWMDVYRSCQHQKVNLCSLMRRQWPIFIKLGMWVVGGTSTTHVVCRHQMCIFVTQHQLMRLFAVKLILSYEQKCKVRSKLVKK